jgi:hypothetical protein
VFGQGFFGQEYFGQEYFSQTGAPVAVWPLPSQVQFGVVYGPNGNDYTGTLTGGVDIPTLVSAIFSHQVEGTETFVEWIRLIRAVNIGKTNGVSPTSASEQFFGKNGTKLRVESHFTPDGERTPVVTDGT